MVTDSKTSCSMKKESIRILHVDSDTEFLKAAKKCLEIEGSFTIETASSVNEALDKIKRRRYDAIVSGYQLPHRDGLEFLESLRHDNCNTPFIVFTSEAKEEIAIKALNLGADRYLRKDDASCVVFCELAHKIKEAVATRRAKERLQDAMDNLMEGCQIIDHNWRYVYVNEVAARHGKTSREALIGKTMMEAYPGIENTLMFHTLQNCMKEHKFACMINEFEYPDGKRGWFKLSIEPIPEGILILSMDITEMKKAEDATKRLEEKYQSLCQNIPGMVYRARPDWSTEIMCNSKDVTGYAHEEFNSGKVNWQDIIHPDDKKRIIEEAAPIREKADSIVQEYRITDKENEVRWVEDHKSSFFSKRGALEGVDGVVFDISERKKIEEQLRESEEKYRELFETSMDAIATSDVTGHFTDCNQACLKMLGYSLQEMRDLSYQQLTPKKFRENEAKIIEHEVMRKGFSAEYEKELIRKDGKTIPVSNKVWMTCDGNGKPKAMWGIVRDITKVKEAEYERAKAEEEVRKNEKKYRELADSLPEIIFEADKNGTVKFYNKRALKILGYNQSDLRSLSLFRFVNPKDQDRARQMFHKVLKGHPAGGNQYEFVRKDGTKLPVLVFLEPLIQPNGRLGVRGMVVDISKQKKAEQAILDSQQKFESLFMKNPEAAVHLDNDFHILKVNPRFSELFGYSSGETMGEPLDSLVVPEDKKEEYEMLKQEAKTGYIYHDTVRRKKDGTLIPVAVSAAPLTSEGKISGYVWLYIDITNRVILEQQLKTYSRDLEKLVEKRTVQLKETQSKLLVTERLAAIGELAGMVGHDLRNPLMSIAGAEYYLRTKLEPQLRDKEIQMLSVIKNSVAYSDKIVNDLQDYSGTIKLELTIASPRKLLEESLSIINIPDNIRILDKTGEKLKIEVDPARVKRVFINVIKNAIDAMPEGGEIVITTEERGDSVIFSFVDTGNGIPKETLERIGKPLFTTKAKGMGFGLAICQRNMEAHRGSITIKSKEGKGTTVFLSFPKKQNATKIDSNEGIIMEITQTDVINEGDLKR